MDGYHVNDKALHPCDYILNWFVVSPYFLKTRQDDVLLRVPVWVGIYGVQCSCWFEFRQVNEFPVCYFLVNFLRYGREVIANPNLIFPGVQSPCLGRRDRGRIIRVGCGGSGRCT